MIWTIILDVANKGGTPSRTLNLRQGDKGSASVVATLLDDGEAYSVPSGAVVELVGNRPDGHVCAQTMSVSGNVASVTLDSTWTCVAGHGHNVYVRIKVGDTVVESTESFCLSIEDSADMTAPAALPYQQRIEAVVAAAEAAQEEAEQALADVEKLTAHAADEAVFDACRAAAVANNLLGTGLDLLHGVAWEQGSISSDGATPSSSKYRRTSGMVDVDPSKSYILMVANASGPESGVYSRMLVYGQDGGFIAQSYSFTAKEVGKHVVTTIAGSSDLPSGAAKARFSCPVGYTMALFEKQSATIGSRVASVEGASLSMATRLTAAEGTLATDSAKADHADTAMRDAVGLLDDAFAACTWESGVISESGVELASSTHVRCSPVEATSGDSFTLTVTNSGAKSTYVTRLHAFRADGTWIRQLLYISSIGAGETLSFDISGLPDDTASIRISIRSAFGRHLWRRADGGIADRMWKLDRVRLREWWRDRIVRDAKCPTVSCVDSAGNNLVTTDLPTGFTGFVPEESARLPLIRAVSGVAIVFGRATVLADSIPAGTSMCYSPHFLRIEGQSEGAVEGPSANGFVWRRSGAMWSMHGMCRVYVKSEATSVVATDVNGDGRHYITMACSMDLVNDDVLVLVDAPCSSVSYASPFTPAQTLKCIAEKAADIMLTRWNDSSTGAPIAKYGNNWLKRLSGAPLIEGCTRMPNKRYLEDDRPEIDCSGTVWAAFAEACETVPDDDILAERTTQQTVANIRSWRPCTGASSIGNFMQVVRVWEAGFTDRVSDFLKVAKKGDLLVMGANTWTPATFSHVVMFCGWADDIPWYHKVGNDYKTEVRSDYWIAEMSKNETLLHKEGVLAEGVKRTPLKEWLSGESDSKVRVLVRPWHDHTLD